LDSLEDVVDHAAPVQKKRNHALLAEIAKTPLGLVSAERAAKVVSLVVPEPDSIFVHAATFNSSI
jgi:hypothetical protein